MHWIALADTKTDCCYYDGHNAFKKQPLLNLGSWTLDTPSSHTFTPNTMVNGEKRSLKTMVHINALVLCGFAGFCLKQLCRLVPDNGPCGKQVACDHMG